MIGSISFLNFHLIIMIIIKMMMTMTKFIYFLTLKLSDEKYDDCQCPTTTTATFDPSTFLLLLLLLWNIKVMAKVMTKQNNSYTIIHSTNSISQSLIFSLPLLFTQNCLYRMTLPYAHLLCWQSENNKQNETKWMDGKSFKFKLRERERKKNNRKSTLNLCIFWVNKIIKNELNRRHTHTQTEKMKNKILHQNLIVVCE